MFATNALRSLRLSGSMRTVHCLSRICDLCAVQLETDVLQLTVTVNNRSAYVLSVSCCVTVVFKLCKYRVAQKSKPLPIFQKIVLKIANEIRFLRKVKV